MTTTISRTGLNATAVVVAIVQDLPDLPVYTTGRIETDSGVEYRYSFAAFTLRPFVCKVD